MHEIVVAVQNIPFENRRILQQVTRETTLLSQNVIDTVNAAIFPRHRLSFELKVYHFRLVRFLKMLNPWRIYPLHYSFGHGFLDCIGPGFDIR